MFAKKLITKAFWRLQYWRLSYSLLLAGLMPVLAAQGVMLKQQALRLPPARGLPHGLLGAGRRLRLLGLGDSIIAGVGATQQEQSLIAQLAGRVAMRTQSSVYWRNVGLSGADTQTLVYTLLNQMDADPYDVIVISTGVNDVTALKSSRHWRACIRQLCEALAKHSPDAHILLLGLPPFADFPLLPQPLRTLFALRAKIFDGMSQAIVNQRPGFYFIPSDFSLEPHEFAMDGYHPSSASYARWAEYIDQYWQDSLTTRQKQRPK